MNSAGTMQLNLGIARVSRAIDGVAPSISFIHISQPLGERKIGPTNLRRDAANHTPEACAPLFNCIVPA